MRFQHLLVTGGAGFIGSHLVHLLAAERPEVRVTVLDKLTYAGKRENLEPLLGEGRIGLIVGDIADPHAVHRALDGCDGIVNLAAETHVDRSLSDATPFVRTNVLGTQVLLDAARAEGITRFLHVSTDEVYGDLKTDDPPSRESDPFRPSSPYSASKAAAEHLVHAYHVSYGLDTVITRGSNSYGPRQYPEKVIPLFTANALAGRPLPIYGSGCAVRDYLHAEDHARGILAVLEQGEAGHAYNLGAGLQVDGNELARRILELTGRPASLAQPVDDRPGHDYRYSLDSSRANALGWRPRWAFEHGLAATVQWYREQQEVSA